MDLTQRFDVLVIGENAALCAAISARLEGASVLVLERAEKFYRGGNTRHTRNMRCAHDTATDTLTGPYPEDELFEDLLRVTEGETDEELARHMIHEVKDMLNWIVEQGVKFSRRWVEHWDLGERIRFFLGGGGQCSTRSTTRPSGLASTCCTSRLKSRRWISGTGCSSPPLHINGKEETVRAGALVAAAGGFESNIDWLAEYWGDAARNFLIRGTANNQGSILKMLLDAGVGRIGDPTQCHAVAIDARAPQYDGGIITRLDCVVFGIVVNKNAERSTTRAKTSGPNAMLSGGGWWRSNPTRSPISCSIIRC